MWCLVACLESVEIGRQPHTLELRPTHSPSSENGCWIAILVCVCVCVWFHETKFRSFPPLYVRKKKPFSRVL